MTEARILKMKRAAPRNSLKPKENDSVKFAKVVVTVIGLAGGTLLLLTGAIVSIISFVEKQNFHGADVMMLITSFFLLAIGSHFLDKIDEANKAEKIQRLSERENDDWK